MKAWMSRVLMPLAYMAMICSSILPNERLCLGTMIGSKVFCRSRGTLSGRGPNSVFRVLWLKPLRLLESWGSSSAATSSGGVSVADSL